MAAQALPGARAFKNCLYCMCSYVYTYVACGCLCIHFHVYSHVYIYIYLQIYMYIHICRSALLDFSCNSTQVCAGQHQGGHSFCTQNGFCLESESELQMTGAGPNRQDFADSYGRDAMRNPRAPRRPTPPKPTTKRAGTYRNLNFC